MKKWLDKYQSKGEVKKPVYQYKSQNLTAPNFNGLATTTYGVTPKKSGLVKNNNKKRPKIKLQNQIFANNTKENVLDNRRNYYFPYETEQTKNIRNLADDQVFKSSGDLISGIHPIGAVINALYQGIDKTFPAEGLKYLPNKIPFKQARGYNNLMPILKPASRFIDPIQMFDKLRIADSLYNSADSIDLYNQFKNGGLVSKNSLNRKVTCSNCGWSWKLSDGGEDPLTCHKCGGTIKMKHGGELDEYKEKGEVKSTFNPYENVNRVGTSDNTKVFRLNADQVENAKKTAAIRNEKIVKEYQQNQRSFIGPDKRTKAERDKSIALKKEYDRVKAMQNSDLAKTFASFTPGNNIEAGVMGAETFANLNPIISGPILATSRLAPAILHPTNNSYWGSDRSNLENTLGALGAIGDISMINPLTKGLTNYIGGSKAFKYAKSYAQHPLLKPITNTFNNRLESIENIKNKLPKFLDPQHHINAQKSLNEANQWINNWYNHPAILERIDNIKKAKSKNLLFSFEEDALLKRIKDKNYVNEFESNLNKIYDFIGGRKRVHKNNYGTSGYGLDLFADQSKRQNLVSKYIDPSKITVTGIHEGTHGLTDGNNLITSYKNMLQKPFDLTDYNPRSIDGTYKRYDDYLLDPPEIYSQINEIRYENNIKPDEIVTPEKVDEIIKKGRSGNSNVIFSFYDLIKDKDNFRNLLNYLPAVIPAAAGVGALQEKKHGGIIEDDMGQWAHPGQVTRINSNKITMQGVPYPVTGVDNLGNTMVMQPGMNYTFPGQYVTEYPMMQYGGQNTDWEIIG